jgi:hypothetical protein
MRAESWPRERAAGASADLSELSTISLAGSRDVRDGMGGAVELVSS